MNIYHITGNDLSKVKEIVKNWDKTMIWSCLQGCMGDVYTDNLENPKSAQFVIGDFCFFAGEPKEELIKNREVICGDFIIMCGENQLWNELIEKFYKENCKKVVRYAFKKESNIFDKNKLQEMVNLLPKDYELKMIDENIYYMAAKERWSNDLCSQFLNGEDYLKRGLGVAILYQNQLVAGASSYTIYNQGIEIEVDTKPDYRKKGLATVAGAKLILECLERNLYPSWDAQNLWSVGLAKKLGYNFSHEYTAYEIMW